MLFFHVFYDHNIIFGILFEISTHELKNKVMKKNYSKNLLFGILALSLSFASCTSSTVIKSIPEEAKVYLNDEFVGTTPYRMSDDKIIYSDTYVELKTDGYKDFSTVKTKDEKC